MISSASALHLLTWRPVDFFIFCVIFMFTIKETAYYVAVVGSLFAILFC